MLNRLIRGCFFLFMCGMIATVTATATAGTIDFESVDEFSLGGEDYGLAGDHGGYYTTGDALFFGSHTIDPPWDYWGGFAVSNRTVVAAGDTLHEFTAAPGTDASGSVGGSYAIGYDDWSTGIGAMINFTTTQDVAGAYFANNVWTAEYMDENYGDEDYYQIVVSGYNANLESVGSVTIDMTDIDAWQWQPLGFEDVYAIGITMQSSDSWTPSYFCIDNISDVPEPGTLVMLLCAAATLLAIRRRA